MKRYWKLCKWNVWSPKSEPLPDTPPHNYRISLCTTCMGRAHDLERTLLVNISDNNDYENLEFVILNYNSNDGIHEFMHSAPIIPHVESGKVRYLRTRSPKYYSMSHSRNIAFLNATGQIVTNVDADNFTGKGFATYLNKLANVRSRRVIFAKGKRRVHGRVGMFKDEFEDIGGYDESLVGYGGDDHSLLLRAMYSGFTLMWWAGSPVDFTRRIVTPREAVGVNMENPNWQETQVINREITVSQLNRGEYIANRGRRWGYVDDLEIFQGGAFIKL